MKKIVLSFDDARADTYRNAWPILKQHNFPCTINVVTDFVEHPHQYACFASGNNESMTPGQLMECEQNGAEIACHGHTHQNTVQDILDNIAALCRMGLKTLDIGFASPFSHITKNNCQDIKALRDDKTISYIRSGIQARREGLLYAAFTWVERKTHSKVLFWWLNQRNVLRDKNAEILPSVGITKHTTVQQILYMIDRMQPDDCVILMFHSVLCRAEAGYGKDEWCYDSTRFKQLCAALKQNDEVQVITTKDALK